MDAKTISAVLGVPHAILYLLDSKNDDAIIPEYVHGKLVAQTGSCVSVGARYWCDGDTEVTLSTASDIPEGLDHIACVEIDVPNGHLAIITSGLDVVLEMPVSPGRTTVSIWADDDAEPDRVFVKVE